VPQTQLLAQGQPVVFVLSIYNASDKPVFVSRLKGDDLLDFKVVGPDGQEVPWQGKPRSGRRGYSSSDFAVLEKYREVSAERTISFRDGAGFNFDKPGQYSVTVEYALDPPARLASFAGNTMIPTGSFLPVKAAFCIEACIHGLLEVHSNAPQSALDAVRAFYTYVTRYRPLGIPEGRAKKALWPLLSKRLVEELDGLQACNDDYYRRYGEFLRANKRSGRSGEVLDSR
jgi:hypothetical protein